MLDQETGLPVVPDDMRWRIVRRSGYGEYDGFLQLQKKNIFGLWKTVEYDLIELGHPKRFYSDAESTLEDYREKNHRKLHKRVLQRSTEHLIGTYPPNMVPL